MPVAVTITFHNPNPEAIMSHLRTLRGQRFEMLANTDWRGDAYFTIYDRVQGFTTCYSFDDKAECRAKVAELNAADAIA